jgi:hypothetical protein
VKVESKTLNKNCGACEALMDQLVGVRLAVLKDAGGMGVWCYACTLHVGLYPVLCQKDK